MSNKIEGKRYHIEKVAPEGAWGWSYLIPLGIAIPGACSIGSLGAFGLLFHDFFEELGASTTSMTAITGTYFCALSFGALAASALSKQFSMRTLGMFGATIFFLGSFLTAFATCVEHLVLTFGLLEGAGYGFMTVAYTTFNTYFVKKRMFAMGLCQGLKGIGIMAYPIMVQFFMNTYGFRGAAVMIAAIHANCFFAMVILHKVEWHCKIIKTPIEESTSLIESNGNGNEMKIDVKLEENNELKPLKNGHGNSTLANGDLEICQTNGNLTFIQNGRSNSHDNSITSHSNCNGSNGASHVHVPKDINNGLWQKMVKFFDLTLLKDLVFVNILFGQCCVYYTDSAFFTFLSMYLPELGFNDNDTALLISISSSADMCSRIILAFMSLCIHLKARTFTLIGAVATISFRYVFLSVTDFSGMVGVLIILGFFRPFLLVTMTLSFAEYLPQERFPTGLGLFLFCKGNFYFLISPIIGWIQDSTQSYVICFNSLTFILALCAVPWIFEIIWFRLKSRKNNKSNVC